MLTGCLSCKEMRLRANKSRVTWKTTHLEVCDPSSEKDRLSVNSQVPECQVKGWGLDLAWVEFEEFRREGEP